MNAKLIAWLILPVVGLFVAGVIAIWLIKAVFGVLFSLLFYLAVGAVVVGGGYYLYRRARRAISSDPRTRRRIEAARATYRSRTHG